MRAFKLELGIDMKAIVTDEWVALMRSTAADPERTTPFLKKATEAFPEDDEEFALMILKNGVRLHVRQSLQDLFLASGLGCTLSPARATVIDRSPPAGVKPVLATQIEEVIPE